MRYDSKELDEKKRVYICAFSRVTYSNGKKITFTTHKSIGNFNMYTSCAHNYSACIHVNPVPSVWVHSSQSTIRKLALAQPHLDQVQSDFG